MKFRVSVLVRSDPSSTWKVRYVSFSKTLYTLLSRLFQKVSMIRKYDDHTLQTNLWHREEEIQNINSCYLIGLMTANNAYPLS